MLCRSTATLPMVMLRRNVSHVSHKRTKKEPSLDPKLVSSSLSPPSRFAPPVPPKNPDTAAKDFDRLLHFMSDDVANTPTPNSSATSNSNNGIRKQSFRPSTKDRIGPNGERIVKQDFEVENLISYTEEFSKPEEDIILHTEEAPVMPSPDALTGTIPESSHADPSITTAADNNRVNIEDDIIQQLDKSLEAVHAARIRQETASKSLSSSSSSSFNPEFYIPPSIASDIPTPTTLKLEREYLILSPTLKIVKSLKKPLHNERSPKDLYTILSQLKSPEKYLRTITKFESEGWSIIGGNDKMLVFERCYSKKDRDAKYLYKLVFGSIASVGVLLGGFLMVSGMT